MTNEKINTLFDVLVYVPEQYKRGFELNGLSLCLDNEVDDVVNTIRHGEVISVPMYYDNIDLKKGDTIYFHHNIIRTPLRMNDKDPYTHGFYDYDRSKGLFLCPVSEIYMIERGGEIKTIEPIVFIKPITNPLGVEYINRGVIRYGNKQLNEIGLIEGTEIVFSRNSDYRFDIREEKLYRMRTDDIIGEVKGDI